MEQKSSFSQGTYILLTSILGIISGYYIGYMYPWHSILLSIANVISKIFIDLLQLISIPVIFLSIVSTISSMESFEEMKNLGKKVLKYTLFTTIIAASVALLLFILIDPSQSVLILGKSIKPNSGSYLAFILDVIPNNMIKALSDNSKVMSVVFVAGLLSFSILSLPSENKKVLQSFFSSLFMAVLNITKIIIYIMPLGIWAFITIFTKNLLLTNTVNSLKPLMLYVICILLANFIQGFIVLPLLLKYKGISPIKTASGMFKALVIAFFTKSSNAALPMTVKCAQSNLNVKPKVASFSLPLCSVINMNGCAAFILITILFVGTKSGITFSYIEMISWVLISTLAAIGNAGVPMGCYFLASAFLVGLGIPSNQLQILGVILPIYTLIDMVETTLNVWSDSCITVIIDKEL